jgi:hypothetical protein
MLTHVTCMDVTPGSMRIHCVTRYQPKVYRGYSLTAKMRSRNPHFRSHGATSLLRLESSVNVTYMIRCASGRSMGIVLLAMKNTMPQISIGQT